MACTCGHSIEEHGHDARYPGSTKCTVIDCPCIAYEADAEEEALADPLHDPEGGMGG